MQQEYRDNQCMYTGESMQQVHVITVSSTRVTVIQVPEVQMSCISMISDINT